MTKRLTNEIVDQRLEKGWKRLDDYINNSTPMRFQCPFDHIVEMQWGQYHSGQRCKYCLHHYPLTNEDIDERLDEGWRRLEDFVATDVKILLRCSNGHEIRMKWSNYSSGKRCAFCKKKAKWSNERVDAYLEELGEGYIRIGDYKGAHIHFLLKCPAGHQMNVTWTGFISKGRRCWQCFLERNWGENHPSWNPDLTEEHRTVKRNYPEYPLWRKAVFQRDYFTCQCCLKRGERINAHHLYNYADYPEHRINVHAGIALCETCHDLYHFHNGNRNNTPERFIVWVNENYPDRLISIYELLKPLLNGEFDIIESPIESGEIEYSFS